MNKNEIVIKVQPKYYNEKEMGSDVLIKIIMSHTSHVCSSISNIKSFHAFPYPDVIITQQILFYLPRQTAETVCLDVCPRWVQCNPKRSEFSTVQ